MISLGIDTGGTYTDAVLVEQSSGHVLAGAKALTTYHDLSIGINQAVSAVFSSVAGRGRAVSSSDIGLVSLSTTLATNAIVEGRGCPVCLLLIGYSPELIRSYGFERELVTSDIVYVCGGHNGAGDEVEPLDEAALTEAILARRNTVEAFAISGYFSVRNPAHELRARALVEQLTVGPDGEPLLVTCGHELTTRLNAVRRATTTALNARLIPLLRELIATLRSSLDLQGIRAPLMVVKGDGSLVRADWAMRRPIETILAGPAASVVGAWHLSGRQDFWVLDMGGTTTDIASLRNGRPRLSPEGARVGGWRTMVEAVDVHTVGLGGDSWVDVDREGRLTIGPRRVVPLSLLGYEHPRIVEELNRQLASKRTDHLKGQFVVSHRRSMTALESDDKAVLAKLVDGPQPLSVLVRSTGYGGLTAYRIGGLESRRLVLRSAFTPTDALHVLGRFSRWNAEAARLGAALLAARMGLSVAAFCQRVVVEASRRAAIELVAKALGDEGAAPNWEHEPAGSALVRRALNGLPPGDLACTISLQHPIVAIGAPVPEYLPATADLLHTDLIIPEYADVANAVGAVAGGVHQQIRAAVRPQGVLGQVRLYMPAGVVDFETIDEAVAHACESLPAQAEALARDAGAEQVELSYERIDQTAPVAAGWGEEVWLESELLFTAVGRPGIVEKPVVEEA